MSACYYSPAGYLPVTYFSSPTLLQSEWASKQEMNNDPRFTKFRKPRKLHGTPFNKYIFGTVLFTSCSLLMFISNLSGNKYNTNMEKYDKNIHKTDSEAGPSSSLDTNTSLLDFKFSKTKLIPTLKQFNFKSETNKKKETKLKSNSIKGLNKKASTSNSTNQLKKNIFHAPKQTESNVSAENNESIKLPNDTKVSYTCPLCFKVFKDSNSRTLHMKNCATKNNISTKILLEAVELQERQSAERVSLGLLAAPVLQNKKQNTINKMFSTKDPQLQLALALSKSLYEVEEAENYNEIEIIADIYSSKDSVTEFIDKDPIETSRIQKRKKPNYVKVLQTRSKEERDRLITEKIAEILIDSQTSNQSQEKLETKRENLKKNNLRSRILKKYLDFDSKLWNSAMLQQNQEDFYVMDLSPHVIPSTKQIFMEIENDSNITNEQETKDLLPTKSNLYSNKKESANTSPKADVTLSSKIEKENISMQSSINTLILDWGNALNNSSSSDTIIFVNNGKHIWVHKLVFYIRCSNILLDIIPNNNTTYSVKEMISWTDIEYHIALAFLEFIYCGIIKKHATTLNNSIAMSSLGRLVRRYKVKELFTYLRQEYTILHDKTSENYKFELDYDDIQEISNNNDVNCIKQSIPNISQIEISHDELLKTIMISPEKNVKVDSHVDRENSMSPDIFNDTNDGKLNHTILDNLNTSFDVLSIPIQDDSEINTNQFLFSSSVNKSKSSNDKCVLNESLMENPKNSQSKQVTDIMADEIKPKSNLTLFIEEIQRENAISDFSSDSEIETSANFIQLNGNPLVKKRYAKSSGLDKFNISKISPDKGEKKESYLSKLENDMLNDAKNNPQLYNITFDRASSTENDCTDLLSSSEEIKTNFTYNDDKHLSEKITLNSQVDTACINASYCSSSKMDTDDPDVYTKTKRKLEDNSIATYRSALKKYKNDTTKQKIDETENIRVIESNSDKVEDVVETDDILKTNSYQNKDYFEEQETDHWNNDNLNTQVISNKSFDNDNCSNIFNLNSPEISDIENEQVSPLKSTNPNFIVLSSDSEINPDSQDIDDFNKNDNISFVRSKELHDSDDELRYNFSNEICFSEINIDDRIEHTILDKNTLHHVSSRNKILKKKYKSEENLQMNYMAEENDQINNFNIINNLQHNKKKNNHKLLIKNKLFTITENDDTSPPNYNIMNTPKLHREMQKYGLKVQNRNKAIKLLTYIYNELHPTIDLSETMDTSTQNMYNEYGESQKKRLKADISLSDKYNNTEYGCSISLLKNWNSNNYATRMETSAECINNIEKSIALDDCDNIEEAFLKLIEFNKDLHNEILKYEPLNIELLHEMLKTGGFKCKINAVIDFLDEKCITFYIPESKTKNRNRR
ncbi:hypothetical protein M0802_002452 [Mischocyttarus mexicanus]|nr:hypothetical protein M0802_002452 [Mischocyttarus mexicanus]